jgi:signal transduction histidine kinase/ActR/RegA family two-component response regulator
MEKLSGTTRGAVLIAEEAIAPDTLPEFVEILHAQPAWSDLPIILLTSGGKVTEASPAGMERFGRNVNVTLLERPLRVITLCTMVGVALRSRRRQYEVRNLLAQRDHVLASERAARSEAERAGRMKDEFLATLSHELRTPLNAIVGWVTLLQAGHVSDTIRAQGLETIERNARAQTRIIEDLLDMSRIISGKIKLDVRPADLGEVITAAMDTVRPAAEAKGILLNRNLEPSPKEFPCDPNRLKQVFWNLLTNAIKFTPQSGTVTVSLRKVNSQVIISVADSGQGIERDFLPFVFDRFRQADSSTTRHQGGLGLGLAIVKQLVELHGGRVTAESAGTELGATFTVALPMMTSVSSPDSQRSRFAPDPGRQPAPIVDADIDLKGVKVLVVEDEPDARDMVKRLLEQRGARVCTAGLVSEALTLLRAHRPDVVISDIGMPGEDGYSLIQRVRALSEADGGLTPAIALTAYARSEDRIHALNHGFQRHAVKPIDPPSLIATVAELAKAQGSECFDSALGL